MPQLRAGETLAHYEIRAHIGEGGMGDVYLAEDQKLNRLVALKILKASEERERFVLEARAASAMNHPNAAHIYEIGDRGDLVYIAMEYVDGVTLEKRLESGPLPIDEVREIAMQLADALAEAFAKGIVHRDLKPANIVINQRGQAKILDFGIAKRTLAEEALADADTAPNTVMGTLPYMSPEQLRASSVDHRSDMFSLGVIVYEMVSGRRPFDGPSLIETLQNITDGAPPPLEREDVPDAIRHVIARCLEKNPARRYATPRQIYDDLGARQRQRPLSNPRWPIAIAIAVLVIAVAILLTPRHREAPQTPTRLIKLTSAPGLEDDPAISPDGKFMVYTSDERGNLDLFVRPLGGGEAIRITDDPADDAQPAWSPNGKRVAFVSARARGGRLSIVLGQALGNFVNAKGGDLYVVPANGGAAMKLVENAFYPSWSPDGKWIAFQSPRGGKWDLWRLPAAGGDPIALTRDDDFDYQPSWSPDGKTIVYASGTPEAYRLKVMDVAGGTPRAITDGQDGVLLNPVFAADGRSLVYTSQRGGSLNLWRLTLPRNANDDAKPEHVTLGEGDHVHPTTSRDGKRIIYAAVRQTPDLWTLDIASEKAEQVTFDTGREEFPHRSRDGAVVFSSDRGGKDALWVLDSRGGVRQVEVKPFINQPRWSPDGKRIACRFFDEAIATIAVRELGDAAMRVIARSADTPSWSPDGRQLVFTMWTEKKPKGQIHIASLDGGAPRPLTSLDQLTSYPTFSPDGKFISFQATRDDGARHVWIVEVATKRVRRLTSGDSEDSHPQWSPVDADKILFVRNHENLMTVSVATGEVRAMTRYSAPNTVLDYPSWSPDGRRVDFSIAPKRGDLYMLESDPEAIAKYEGAAR